VPSYADPRPLAKVIESLWHTEHHVWWTAHKEEVLEGQRIRAFGPREPRTDEERRAFLSTAMSFVGKRYGWWKLFVHLWDRVKHGGKKRASKKLFIDGRPICSYSAAKANAVQNIGFGMEPQAATPDEMLDFCESKRGKIVFIERGAK
jgi:hypothetical protein